MKVFVVKYVDGVIGKGVVFDDGTVAIQWVGDRAVCVYASVDELKAYTNHDYTNVKQVGDIDIQKIQHLRTNRAQDYCESVNVDFTSPSHQYVWNERDKILDLFKEIEL